MEDKRRNVLFLLLRQLWPEPRSQLFGATALPNRRQS